VLVAAGIIALLTVLTERLLALSVVNYTTVLSFWAVVAVAILLLWLLRQPSRMQVSLLLDDRLRLHERFSTTLAMADVENPFADAARREAHQNAEYAEIRGHFPIRPSKCWIYAVSAWLTVMVCTIFLPQKDLLGFLRRKEQQEQKTQQLEQAKVAIKEAADPVKSTVERLGEPELADTLASLDQTPTGAKPQEVKRQAIRKLGDLSDKIQKMQNSAQLDAVNMLQNMFKQLRGSADPFSQKVRLALAKGNFAQASNLLSQLQKELAEGKLNPEQRKALSKQLQELARQLAALAEKNDQFEKELEKLGLDRKLAKMSDEQLRQALQKKGLSSDKIDELMRKAAASRSALSRCAGLGRAMAACGAGGLSGDELASLMGQLDDLESLQQQLMLTQATLDEIARAIGCLGEGISYEPGGYGPFAEGYSRGAGGGTGGPGIGWGPRKTDDSGATATKRYRTRNKPGQGPVIASWYFKESQIKGEARRDFTEVVQAARDGAAEAISENEIPRRYEDAIKTYFGQLEQSGGE
jgi:RNA polymerase-interacting CarD/CdnL/TRCF family regulator